MHGASNMVVRGCHIQSTGEGIDFEIGNAVRATTTLSTTTWWAPQSGRQSAQHRRLQRRRGDPVHRVRARGLLQPREGLPRRHLAHGIRRGLRAVSIDICNNDIEEATDDAVEADSAMGNVRVVRNRVRNCFDGMTHSPTWAARLTTYRTSCTTSFIAPSNSTTARWATWCCTIRGQVRRRLWLLRW